MDNTDLLNPDSEQELFEKLSMSKLEYDILSYIRKDMKSLLVLEKWMNEKQSNKR